MKNFCLLFLILGCTLPCTLGRYLLMAEFNMGGVRGAVMFNQANQTDALSISVQVKQVEPAPWRILTHPTVYSNNAQASCSDLGAVIPNGDLNVTHGLFGYRSTYYSMSLKAFGTDSILGRSLVLYYPNDTIRACATILPFNANVTYATAVFRGPVGGKVHFMQIEDMPEEATLVWGELYHTDGVTSVSDNHNWFVSEEPVTMFGQCSNARTVFGAVQLLNHTCGPAEPAACLIGDLGGKVGNIGVGVAGNAATRKRFRYVTFGLPLSGSQSIIRHGLVLKKAIGDEPKACTSVLKAGPIAAEAMFEGTVNAGVSGIVAFKQQTPLHSTKIEVVLSTLANRCGGYHIHAFPIPSPTPADPCSALSVGGHYNPFSIDNSSPSYPEPGNATVENYEVGDLSSKFGTLHGQSSIDATYFDPSLTLFGSSSFLGRAIVLHRNDSTSSRLTCANIFPSGAGKLTAKADFNVSSTLSGSVVFQQFYQNNDVITDTTITVDLKHRGAESNVTMQHNWHVHIEPVGNDTFDPMATRCASVGPHYNPYNVSTNKPSYPTECSSQAPYRCELGDISSKQARYNIGGGKKYYVDENLPLYGAETVLGRSLMFHEENAGGPRLACADLVPQQGESVTELKYEVKNSNTFYKGDFQRDLSHYLSVYKWQVSYPTVRLNTRHSCYSVSFFLIDHRQSPDVHELARRYRQTVAPKPRIGGLEKCGSGASSIASLTSVILIIPSLVVFVLWSN